MRYTVEYSSPLRWCVIDRGNRNVVQSHLDEELAILWCEKLNRGD